MRLPDETDFRARSVFDDDLGQKHVRIEQFQRGVRVFGGDLVVHMDRGTGRVLSVTDDARRNVDVGVEPAVPGGEAVALAHRLLAPFGAYVEEPEAELVIWTSEEGAPSLAWHVHAELENDFETRHDDFIVDAATGTLLKRWDSLETAAAVATGRSEYSGTVPLDTNSITGGYELRDTTRGAGGSRTLNMNKRTSGGTIFTNTTTTWGDGLNYVTSNSTTGTNGQTAAVDAHFGMAKTWDYYKTIHGRNGIDAKGTATYSRVHYSRNYDNAFWSDSCFCMTYGDGSVFKVLTAIDVAGHEMSHGVCSRTANLTYSGESGGLNEANSDIFGTMVEFFSRGGTGGNYTIGEQLSTPSFPKPLRYMYKPSLDGRSPDCWSSTLGSLDVHYSSGVGNRFFYFLAEGSSALSGAGCNGASVSGIGRAAAEKIWYRALTVYMTSSTNYRAARTATLNAANDLYGAGSVQAAAVAAAWSAVNVN